MRKWEKKARKEKHIYYILIPKYFKSVLISFIHLLLLLYYDLLLCSYLLYFNYYFFLFFLSIYVSLGVFFFFVFLFVVDIYE